MQLYEPARLFFLWLIPFVVLIFWWSDLERRRRLSRLGNSLFIQDRLMPEFSLQKKRWGRGLLIAALLLAIFALARPQWGEEKKKIERKGVDLIFLLDTSLSMLAEDVKPNRFTKSKLEIKNIIRRLKGDRVGMIAFSGSSFLQCPLTLDYSAFFLFLDSLKVGYIPNPGTSLARALELLPRAFPEEGRKHRSVVLFSDGEDHEGRVKEALAEVKKAGIRVYTIGVGTPEGEPIPLRSVTTEKVTAYKKDRQGQVVITRLNSELLGEIARETGGLYLPATPAEKEVEIILKHLETLGERQLKEKIVSEREEHFQLFLLLAFLLLVGETVLGNRKQMASKLFLPLLGLSLLTGFIDSPASLVKKGNRQVAEKRYQSAVENYRKAEVVQPTEPIIRYNLGTSLYQLYEYRDAERELEQALAQVKDPSTKAKILYNYGNTQYRLGNFEKAIDAYKKVLDIDPRDEDAKYNLEFLKQKKSLFEKKREEKQNQKQKNQQQQKPQPQPRKQQQEERQQQQGGQGGLSEGEQKKEKEEDKEEKGIRGEGQQEQQKNERKEEEDQRQEQQKESAQKIPESEQRKEEQEQEERKERSGEEIKPAEERKIPRPLQGQMSLENALQILDVLHEGEKKLHDLRQPPLYADSSEVEKDW